MSRSQIFCFVLCLNATIALTSTLANEYPFSNETSKKNGRVRGDCIACDALLDLHFSISDGFVQTKIYDKRDDFDFDNCEFSFSRW